MASVQDYFDIPEDERLALARHIAAQGDEAGFDAEAIALAEQIVAAFDHAGIMAAAGERQRPFSAFVLVDAEGAVRASHVNAPDDRCLAVIRS